MKRAALATAGAVALLLAIGAGVFGWLVHSVFGNDGKYRSEIGTIQTDLVAAYLSTFNIAQESTPKDLVDVHVTAKSRNGKEVFLGLGKPQDVQPYLAWVPYASVKELRGNEFVFSDIPGQAPPPAAPATKDFWETQGQGQEPSIDWRGQDGSLALVVMNADSSPGVDADLEATMSSPHSTMAKIASAVLAVLLGILGISLILKALRRSRVPDHRAHDAPPSY